MRRGRGLQRPAAGAATGTCGHPPGHDRLEAQPGVEPVRVTVGREDVDEQVVAADLVGVRRGRCEQRLADATALVALHGRGGSRRARPGRRCRRDRREDREGHPDRLAVVDGREPPGAGVARRRNRGSASTRSTDGVGAYCAVRPRWCAAAPQLDQPVDIVSAAARTVTAERPRTTCLGSPAPPGPVGPRPVPAGLSSPEPPPSADTTHNRRPPRDRTTDFVDKPVSTGGLARSRTG